MVVVQVAVIETCLVFVTAVLVAAELAEAAAASAGRFAVESVVVPAVGVAAGEGRPVKDVSIGSGCRSVFAGAAAAAEAGAGLDRCLRFAVAAVDTAHC